MTESPLDRDTLDTLLEAANELELEPDDLEDLVDAVLSGEVPADEELAFRLGAWWGLQVREITGWRWVELTLGDLVAPALVSRDRGVAVFPLILVAEVLEGRHPNTLATILERLRRGERPSGDPRSYALLT